MFFTLAVSAATAEGCAALTRRALDVDPSVMPVPGPAAVAWRSADGRAALLHWGDAVGGTPGSGSAGPGSARPRPGVRLARGHDLGQPARTRR